MSNFALTDGTRLAIEKAIDASGNAETINVAVSKNAEMVVSIKKIESMMVLTEIFRNGRTYFVGISNKD